MLLTPLEVRQRFHLHSAPIRTGFCYFRRENLHYHRTTRKVSLLYTNCSPKKPNISIFTSFLLSHSYGQFYEIFYRYFVNWQISKRVLATYFIKKLHGKRNRIIGHFFKVSHRYFERIRKIFIKLNVNQTKKRPPHSLYKKINYCL